jgi:site-specific DNA recombinase
MLNNPFYIGLIRIKRTNETFSGSHQPLIPTSLFERVERVLKGKTKTRSQKHDFIFRRLLTCKRCGYSLRGETQKGHVYYRCHTTSCAVTCVREETVEKAVLAKLFEIQLSENEKTYLQEEIAHLKEGWGKEQEAQRNALNLRLNHIQDRLDRLTDAYIDRLIDKEVFENRKSTLFIEQKEVEETSAHLKENGISVPNRVTKLVELAESAYLQYRTDSSDEKRDLLKIITSNRQVDGKNLELRLAIPFDEIANRFKNENGVPHRDTGRTCDALLQKLEKHFKDNPAVETRTN